MLARANRIVRADDYRNTVRRGRKSATAHCVVYVRPAAASPDDSTPARFGFIVSKAVGNAVVRNTVRRRLKAIAYESLESAPRGTDIVIRALPGSVEAPWLILREEITRVITTVMGRETRVGDKGVKA